MIVFVHSSLPVGGAEILRKTVAQELAIRNVPFRICLIKGGGKMAHELKSLGINIDKLGKSNSIYNPFTTFTLLKYFLKYKPSLVQSSQFNSNFHTRIAAKLAKVPVVICEEHGLNFWKKWRHKLVDRYLVNWCERIIAVSEAVKTFNIDVIGLPDAIIKVLPNCIDISRFQPSEKIRNREDVREELNLKQNDFVFGHVGTLRQEKGHDVLLQSFAKFKRNYSAKLILVGDGPQRSRLEDLCNVLDIEKDVIFCGIRNDIPDILNALDVFVFPSRNEAFGIALLEAMYSGLPVIGAKAGGIPEIISDRKTGVLVSPEDSDALCKAMIDYYDDVTLRKRLGTAAHYHVESNHDVQQYIDQLLKLYNELLLEKGLNESSLFD